MVGRIFCTKCTLHSNHRLTHVIFQHTKVFSPGAAIFSLHIIVSPSGRNVNYDNKNNLLGQTFLSCSFYLYRFRKYVSYRFLIINFCNPGVHYETLCTTYCYRRRIFIIQRNSGMSFLPTKYLIIELLLLLVIVYPLNL